MLSFGANIVLLKYWANGSFYRMNAELSWCIFCHIPFFNNYYDFVSYVSYLCDCIHGEWILIVCILRGRFYGSRGRDQNRTSNDGYRARSRSPGKAVGVSNWWFHALGATQFSAMVTKPSRWWYPNKLHHFLLLSCLNRNITNLGYGSPTRLSLIWSLGDASFRTICLWL